MADTCVWCHGNGRTPSGILCPMGCPLRLVSFEATPSDGLYLVQEWITGHAGDDVEFDLTCGAGVGSPVIKLTVKVGDQRRTEVIDIRAGLTEWVTRMVDEIKKEEN